MRNVKPCHSPISQLQPLLLPPPPHLPPSTPQQLQPCRIDGNQLHLLKPTASAATTSRTIDFPHLLKTCASLSLLPLGRSLHQHSISLGLAADPHLATSLLHMYAANHRTADAQQVFDQMPVKNVVPYSAMISAYSRSSNMNAAIYIYSNMLNDGIRPNSITFLGLLSGVSELFGVECIHASLFRFGFDEDLVVVNSMINVYSLCERLDLARSLFDSMSFRDTVSWNSMVAGYSRSGSAKDTMILVQKMRIEQGFFPDQQTFGGLITSLTNSSRCSTKCGTHVHALIITSGFESDPHLVTTIISMYLKLNDIDRAIELFDRSPEKDAVMWTAMISGLVQIDRADEALFLFRRMSAGVPPPLYNETTAIAVSACAQLGLLRTGASIHGFVIRHCLPLDNAVNNSLITFYAKSGQLRQSRSLFQSIKDPDLVSWNAIISGLAHNACLEDAFRFFNEMMISSKQKPDSITISSLLQGCAAMAALDHGKMLHSFIIRHEINNSSSSLSTETSLIDMYSKCGHIRSAKKCFDRMMIKDVVAWSAIIAGYAAHGMGNIALNTYSDFLKKTKLKPNSIMLLSILSACSHSGLVSEGLTMFKSMKEKLGLEPRVEHYACIVDLLYRAGCCGDEGDLVKEMELKQQGLDDAGSYVQIANKYAAMRRWDEVGEVLRRMRGLGLKKTPGWSFVEINGRRYLFFADDSSNERWEEIMGLLSVLGKEMKVVGDDDDDDRMHLTVGYR